VHVNFSRPGFWTLIAETTTQSRLIGTTYIQVKAKGHADTKIPGDTAIPSVTPTVANNEGVSPICTRKPPCDMHQITLKDAIGSGKPTAFFVGTPEFCQSRNCGPSLDELLAVENNLHGQANFVHAEVYLNDQTQTIEHQIPSPTFKEWGFQSEPWLFVIDRNGVIASRFEGDFTASQAPDGSKIGSPAWPDVWPRSTRSTRLAQTARVSAMRASTEPAAPTAFVRIRPQPRRQPRWLDTSDTLLSDTLLSSCRARDSRGIPRFGYRVVRRPELAPEQPKQLWAQEDLNLRPLPCQGIHDTPSTSTNAA
jgi:hypothetical protein